MEQGRSEVKAITMLRESDYTIAPCERGQASTEQREGSLYKRTQVSHARRVGEQT